MRRKRRRRDGVTTARVPSRRFGVRPPPSHFYPEGLANFRESNLIDLSIAVTSGSSRALIGVPDLPSCARTVARATTDRNVVFAISFPQCHLETVRNQKKRKETVFVSKYIRKQWHQVLHRCISASARSPESGAWKYSIRGGQRKTPDRYECEGLVLSFAKTHDPSAKAIRKYQERTLSCRILGWNNAL